MHRPWRADLKRQSTYEGADRIQVSLNAELEVVRSGLFSRRTRWVVWAVKSSLAVSEQALIAGSNFLLNVLVARWLTAEEYGAYAIAFAVYILLLGLYQGLILEPMTVLFANLDEQRFRACLGSLLRVQLWISGVLAICVVVTVLGLFAMHLHSYVAWTLLALIPSLPFILVFWLLRSACYVRRSPQYATQAALVYSSVMLAGLVLYRHWFPVSGSMVFLGMGVSAAAVSWVLIRKLRPIFRSDVSDREQWLEHWRFGRWELSKIGFDWVCENISYTLTAGFLGIVQVGALKALNTLFLPQAQIMSALRRLFIPHLAAVSERQGRRAAAKLVWRMAAAYLVGALVYGSFVSVMAKPLFRLMYAGKYMEYAHFVPWLAASAFVGVPGQVIDMGLRAIRSPQSIFTVSCFSAIACICITVPLTWAFAIRGAIASIVLSTVVMFVIISIVFRRKTRMAHKDDAVAAVMPS